MSSAIYLLIGVAYIAAFVFSIEGVPTLIVRTLHSISDDRIVILLMVNIGLLLLGMVLDMMAILILTVPALMAVGKSLGLDPRKKEYHVERYLRESLVPRIASVSRKMIFCYVAERVFRFQSLTEGRRPCGARSDQWRAA